ncbi:MAG: hypothetical protein RLZZ237_4205 [Pseudomonadota bacterium]
MIILLLGATGLVGRHVLEQALADDRITRLVAPTRRALRQHPKLLNPTSSRLEELTHITAITSVDAVICAIGTRISNAGSQTKFRQVEYALPIEFAKAAHEGGAYALALVSAPGASVSAPFFFSRTKGELERDIQRIGFGSVTIIRPGMIGGDREEFRLAERIVLPIASFLKPLLPRGLWINPATNIAHILIGAVMDRRPGLTMLSSRDLVEV